jgi:hypothetical protein
MRTVWRGTISFGLVTIPVRLYVATESKNVPSHQIHVSDGGRVQYKRVCSIDGAEVPYEEIGRPEHHVRSRLSRFYRYLPLTPFTSTAATTSSLNRRAPKRIGCCGMRFASKAASQSPRSHFVIARSSRYCGCTMMCSSWRRCSGPTRSGSLGSRSWRTMTSGLHRARSLPWLKR